MKMKIVFCGPPHSGKSVLVAELEKRLPVDSFKTIRMTKDGEGRWSNNKKQDEVLSVRYKESFDEKFIADMCEQINRAEQSIVLVDIGGKLLPDKDIIFKTCDAFVILSREKDLIPQWREKGEANEASCIGEIFSDLNGEDSFEENRNIFYATLSHLERGCNLRHSKTIDSIAAYLIKKSGYKKMPSSNPEIFDFNILADKIGCIEKTIVNGIEIKSNAVFVPTDAPKICEEIKNFSLGRSECKIYGARANWCTALSLKVASDCNAKKFFLYDTGFAEYVEIIDFQKSTDVANSCVDIKKHESAGEILVDILCTKKPLTLDDYKEICLPIIDENKTLYVSGKIPNWLLCSVLKSYKNKNKYVFQPGFGFVCVGASNDSCLGTIRENGQEIDIVQAIIKFNEERKL